MSNGCRSPTDCYSSNACKLSPMDSISNVGAIGIHAINSVGVRYVDACSNDLLVVMMDVALICEGNLLSVRYSEGQMRV